MKRRSMKFTLGLVAFASLFCVASTGAVAQYPEKPVSITVPFGPSGSTGLSVNQLIPYLSKYLGQRAVMINKGGAGGRIGATEAYRAKPDGYALLAHNLPTIILGELVFNAKYEVDKYVQIYGWIEEPLLIAVNKDSPYKTFKDLMAAAKQKDISASIVGFGTTSHVLSAMLKKIGLKHRPIPFGSGSKAVKALLGNNADFGMPGAVSGQPHVDSGRIRVLAVTAEKPVASYPGVPTLKELGYSVGLSMYRGLMAPPGTDAGIAKKLAEAMDKAVRDPEFLEMSKKAGQPVVPMKTSEWQKVIQKSVEELKQIAPAMKADMAKK